MKPEESLTAIPAGPDGLAGPDGAAGVRENEGAVPPAGTSQKGRGASKSRALAQSFSAFRHRNFTIFWIGAIASNTGGWISNLTVPYILFSLTGSAVWVALATVAQMGPAVFLGPWGGYVADRFDRKRVLLTTQSIMAAVGAAMWLVWAGGVHNEYVLLGLVCLMGIANGINMPSWQAFVNDLVPRDDLPSAIALNSLQFNAARSLGPAIAGVLLAAFGASWAFFLNTLSFTCVIVALAMVKPLHRSGTLGTEAGIFRQFGQACTYVTRQRGILIAIILSMLVGLLGHPLYQLTVVFADSVFRVGPTELGLMNAALGIGAVLAAPFVVGWSRKMHRSSLVFWGMLSYGLAMVGFGVTEHYVLGLVFLLAVGACFLAVFTGINTAIQMIVAEGLRGRVFAIRHMLFMAAMPAGALLQGFVADRWGVQLSVVLAGTALCVAALAIRLLLRANGFSRLDDPQDIG
ncbi:MAG: MFS transporter [Arthrobacter sp.]